MPISVANRRSASGLAAPLRALVRAALAHAGRRAGEVGLVLTGDPEIRSLNRRWRGLDRATDVLSFGYERRPGPVVHGDIIVSMDRVAIQARRFRVTPGRELARLVIHGALHLAGLDHHTAPERRVMRRSEAAVLRAARPPIAVLDRALSPDRRRTGKGRRVRLDVRALALALILAAAMRAGGAAAATRDWASAIRGSTALVVSRLEWSNIPRVANRCPAQGDFRSTATTTLRGNDRRRLADLLLKPPGVTYGPDCGAYGLPCAEELAFAIDVEPEAVDVHALVFFRERRVLFEHAGRIVGSRRLDADAEPLLRMVRAPRDTVRMPAFHDPDAGVGQDSRLCVFVDRAPVAVRTAPPAYPDSVRDAGVVGTVVTRILIDTEGRVRGANMIQSVPRLDEAVRDAVRQWRFEPALCGGQPVTVWVDLPFTFRLH